MIRAGWVDADIAARKSKWRIHRPADRSRSMRRSISCRSKWSCSRAKSRRLPTWCRRSITRRVRCGTTRSDARGGDDGPSSHLDRIPDLDHGVGRAARARARVRAGPPMSRLRTPHIVREPHKRPRTRLEPWLANYYHALRHRHQPLIFLLVSWDEAVQIADGAVPARLRKQVRKLMTWMPKTREPKPDI